MTAKPISAIITPSIILPAVIKATPDEIMPIAIPNNASIVIVLSIKILKKFARNLFLKPIGFIYFNI